MNITRLASIAIFSVMTLGCSGGSSDNESAAPSLTQISIEIDEQGMSVTPNALNLKAGESGEFSLTLTQGYKIESLNGCGATYNQETGKIKVTATETSCSIKVTAQKKRTMVPVTSSVLGYGSLPSLPQSVEQGSRFDIIAKPQSDHILDKVTGCGASVDNRGNWRVLSAQSPCHIEATFTSNFAASNEFAEPIRLPVVIHVIENDNVSISDEVARSHVELLNMHFRLSKLFADFDFLIDRNSPEHTPMPDKDRQYIADTGITFYLATNRPDGALSTGINRISANQALTEQAMRSSMWDANKVINVWVGEKPASAIDQEAIYHLKATSEPNSLAGIAIDHSKFSDFSDRRFDAKLGKTLTHSMGHYLGLIGHIAQGPENGHRNLPCDGVIQPSPECTNKDLLFNYMRDSQVVDENKRMFSISQANLMRQYIQNGPLQALYYNVRDKQ
ncbi:zinc metalloprotease [Pseudoalteromonas piscicida]